MDVVSDILQTVLGDNLWLVAGAGLAAFLASVLSGMAGYGAGLILPVFIAPLVGVEYVVPVLAVALVFNNAGRVLAFRRDIDWTRVRRILIVAAPMSALGAYGYAALDVRWVAILLGGFLLLSLPLRRWMARLKLTLGAAGERTGAALFGFINGGMTGTGIFLITILMAAGLDGVVLIATDAVISACLGLLKIVVFSQLALLTPAKTVLGLLIGVCTLPGGFVARHLLIRIPGRVHMFILEGVVALGAVLLIWKGLHPEG